GHQAHPPTRERKIPDLPGRSSRANEGRKRGEGGLAESIEMTGDGRALPRSITTRRRDLARTRSTARASRRRPGRSERRREETSPGSISERARAGLAWSDPLESESRGHPERSEGERDETSPSVDLRKRERRRPPERSEREQEETAPGSAYNTREDAALRSIRNEREEASPDRPGRFSGRVGGIDPEERNANALPTPHR